MEQQPKNPVEGTIFEEYDTIIFDLDGTVWDVTDATGQGNGAYTTVAPYKVENPGVAVDTKGNIIQLQEGVDDLLRILNGVDKNLGIISSGERQDRPFEAQPSVMLLKLFNIYKYFTYEIVIRRTEDKEAWIKPFGKTLFIDDSQLNLDKVNALGTVDVLWRRAFGPWKSLMVPKDSQLNFNMYPPEQTPWQKR
jgi:predicted phosphatase